MILILKNCLTIAIYPGIADLTPNLRADKEMKSKEKTEIFRKRSKNDLHQSSAFLFLMLKEDFGSTLPT